MNDRQKENFFTSVRLGLLILITAYSSVVCLMNTGVSFVMLLFSAVFIALLAVQHLVSDKNRIWYLLGATAAFAVLLFFGKTYVILCGFLLIFEYMSHFKAAPYIYYLAIIGTFVPGPENVVVNFLIVFLLASLYVQNDHITEVYRKQMLENTVSEQNLKKDIYRKDSEMQAEREKNRLKTENKILEERAELSQTLHDKLGHNINGSIYQLEAAKLLIDKDPEKSKEMIGKVNTQLRSGMDEIRAILRKERPEKKKLSMIRLFDLCEDCNSKGVEADLQTEGELELIKDDQWETILDNAFEAVSNSMKYAKCKHIDISIIVMNKMIRCTIKDDGVGCKNVVDGMGIAGMRQRMRNIGGIISFETDDGFTINMLIPMEGSANG